MTRLILVRIGVHESKLFVGEGSVVVYIKVCAVDVDQPMLSQGRRGVGI